MESLEAYYDGKLISRKIFNALLKLNGINNTYIITNDGIILDRFKTDTDAEAIKKFND